MTQSERLEQPADGHSQVHAVPRGAASAPELPHEIAKQYGLHEHAAHDTAESQAAPEDAPIVTGTDVDAAVDDIMAKESDALLEAGDSGTADEPTRMKRGFWRSFGRFFAAWWRNKWARYATLVVLLAGLGFVVVTPSARYYVLNTVGVRSSASLVVLDNATQLPLKNVTIQLAGQQAKTDVDGRAKFSELKLGPTKLAIKRIAFAPESRDVTIGWGSNPLGEYKLRATGIQYVLYATDYLSGKGIVGAEAVSDEANALSDKSGKIVLTVADTETTKLAVTVQAKGYRSQEVLLDAERDTMAPKAALVPDVRDVFVSKESGTYDVYSMDLDGKNKQLVLKGTGIETNNISLVVNTAGDRAALVSTRDNVRDSDGYLMTTLTLINLEDGTSTAVDRGAQIKPVDWIGGRLIYQVAIAGASAANSQRYRVVSYNFDTNTKSQLASANQFNAVVSAGGSIYYAASSTDPKANLGLFKIKPDSTGRKKVFDGEVWTAFRTTYDMFSVQTPQGWYTYQISSEKVAVASAPPGFTSHLFVGNPAGGQSAWVEERDGNGTLQLYDVPKDKNTLLATHDGLAYPVRWAGERAIIYRVATSTETADYAVSPAGGEPRKIGDVTATYGFALGS